MDQARSLGLTLELAGIPCAHEFFAAHLKVVSSATIEYAPSVFHGQLHTYVVPVGYVHLTHVSHPSATVYCIRQGWTMPRYFPHVPLPVHVE
jgi:hypothetical protein